MQLRNGSLKHYIPGHYELGYLLVAYGREKYGDDFWKNVTHDAASFKPLFYPMQGAIKKYAGISYYEFVKNAFDYYHTQWSKEEKNSVDWITGNSNNNVVNYKYPYTAEDGSLIFLKSTYRDIPAFYTLSNDEQGNSTEKKIAVRDIAYDDYFSYNNGKIVYASYQADIRWGNQDYSIIKLLDINSGEKKNISSHTKYFSPDISHDGSLIAAVEIKEKLQSDIVIMNAEGIVSKRFSNNENLIYSYPKFSDDDKFLFACVRNNNGEMGIEKIDLATGEVSTALPMKNRIVGFPVVKGDTLIYSCSDKGKDEIWMYINSENKNYRIAGFETGLYQATFENGTSLIASAFTSSGYRLARVKIKLQEINDNDTLVNLYVNKINNSTNL